MKQLGFTLLEVLIAVVILAIISTMTAVNISRSIKFKGRIEQELDDYAAVRDALVIITHDINTAFHWVDLNAEMLNRLNGTSSSASPTPSFNSRNTGLQVPIEKLTSFYGEPDSLYFTTLSHVRTIKDTPESDQAKIGYYVSDAKSYHDKKTVKALIRAESSFLDGENKKNLKESVLLENVKTFKLRYLGGDGKEWVETWHSIETDSDTTRNKFPDAVEITITTIRGTKEITLSTMASVHMPNNDLMNSLAPSAGPSGSPTVSPTPRPT